MYIIPLSILLFVMWVIFANTRKYTGKNYPPPIQAFAHFYSVVFLVVDVFFNVTAGTVIFMELPHYKRLTLTMRLRHILYENKMGWRWKLANFACRRLIEPWDTNHCGIGYE